MQLRPRQKEFVDRCIEAINEKNNTIGIAPTGAGKTVMLSSIAAQMGGRALILQHRGELVSQNRATFLRVAPNTPTDLYNADRKRWSEGVTFGMVQTLSLEDNLASIPALDLLVIDEAHHVAATSYKKVIQKARAMNPEIKILGVTATPQRGDCKGLTAVFSNVADIIRIGEMVGGGFLVRPRFFVIDLCIKEELSKVRITASDFDMEQVAAIMDKEAITTKVFEEWKKTAGDRRTVIFCSTVDHAKHVKDAFMEFGIKTCLVYGDMPESHRKQIIAEFDQGIHQVIVNVAVLTEGWDCQPVSCVVLLRPCSYKSTMIQMIGRGLRKVDPEKYPNIIKDDCIVLDFGYSLAKHGSIEASASIEERTKDTVKNCPDCNTEVPVGTEECPMCGACLIVKVIKPEPVIEPEKEMKIGLDGFGMKEVDLLDASPYKYQDLFDGMVTIANAMSAWSALVLYNERWYALGKLESMRGSRVMLFGSSPKDNRPAALASADDFLREYGDSDASKKNKRWLTQPATDKQLQVLGLDPLSAFGVTKYLASCQITWQFNEREIQRLISKP